MTWHMALALTLLLGVPMMLLALGVLAHAYALLRPTTAGAAMTEVDAALEALATESVDELLVELHRSVEDIRGQLAGQRRTLEDLLSDEARRPLAVAAATAPIAQSAPAISSMTVLRSYAPISPGADFEARVATPGAAELRGAVDQLVAEGLSDRSIARRLHIGLEEVRIARSQRSRAR